MGGGRRHMIPTTVYDREERNQRGRRTDGRNLLDEWVHDKKTRDLNAEYVWNKAQFDKVDPRHTDYLMGQSLLIVHLLSLSLAFLAPFFPLPLFPFLLTHIFFS